ncbi:MAG: 3,4-dehydroadipyl-CoA semialdehyde dehydrogenase, partial [Casimicrobium sp.]
GGRWQTGRGDGVALIDPVLGNELVRVDATGLDLAAGFAHAREHGGAALRALTYAERAAMLAKAVAVLNQHRDRYYEIATANSGTVKNDSAVDIDGGIYTLGYYAKLGESLGARRFLLDGESARLGKDPLFQSQHVLTPTRGVALFINAFNFPSWGLWEKAAPALLSGVPVIVKPATATAWLTQQMVKDVIDAGIFPAGALSIVCGSSAGLMDQLQPFDVISFTGSAETAQTIRSHPAIGHRSTRVNIEADSINSALLVSSDDASLDLFAKEVAREMTVKSGQKCTAIRRAFVPEALYAKAAEAISARLAKTSVGNPRNEQVRMGALVNRAQLQSVRDGWQQLKTQTETLHNGENAALIDADPNVACCIGPTLLGAKSAAHADSANLIHDIEVFGPVATLIPYRNLDHAYALIRRGQGSLVASIYGNDASELANAAIELADSHGRVHAITPDVGAIHSGHGNVMPHSLHGGPGRAGGGEELGGIRALNFYHRRSAIQASTTLLDSYK